MDLEQKIIGLEESLRNFKAEVRDCLKEQTEKCQSHALKTHEHTIEIGNMKNLLDDFSGNIKDLNNVLTTFIHTITGEIATVREKTSDTDKFKAKGRDIVIAVLMMFVGYLIAGVK
jgi:hypothetical protein